jgi:thiamine pyrophosphate-dependent acetolactate synthase large subunit-like protein
LPIIFLILDNQKFASTINWGLSNEYVDLPETDWGLFAESMGIRCYRAFSSDEFLHTLNQCRRLDGPVVLWVRMEDTVNEALRQENHLEFSNWLSEFRKNRSQNL